MINKKGHQQSLWKLDISHSLKLNLRTRFLVRNAAFSIHITLSYSLSHETKSHHQIVRIDKRAVGMNVPQENSSSIWTTALFKFSETDYGLNFVFNNYFVHCNISYISVDLYVKHWRISFNLVRRGKRYTKHYNSYLCKTNVISSRLKFPANKWIQ